MIAGEIENPSGLATLNMFIRELKRTHTSRYPLCVEWTARESVSLIDMRYKSSPVLQLVAMGGDTYRVWSPLIRNEKYSYSNPEYHTRKSSDLAKVRRWLKEYAVPHTPLYIAKESYDSVRRKFDEWKNMYYMEIYNTYRSLHVQDFLEDLLQYQETGIPYQSPKLAAIHNEEFLMRVRENSERKKVNAPKIHVLLNPDDVVNVSKHDSVAPELLHTDRYEALDPEMRSNITMLKMSDPNKFVPNVGIRLDDFNFWVYK